MADECEPQYLDTFGFHLSIHRQQFTPDVGLLIGIKVADQKVGGLIPLGDPGEPDPQSPAKRTAAQLRALANELDPEGDRRG